MRFKYADNDKKQKFYNFNLNYTSEKSINSENISVDEKSDKGRAIPNVYRETNTVPHRRGNKLPRARPNDLNQSKFENVTDHNLY